MFSSTALFNTAAEGSWIKEKFRGDRSLGFVLKIDKTTNMMHVMFPKVSQNCWLTWRNHGHYFIINT